MLLKGVDTSLGSYPSAPLHQVYISSSHVNGPVTVGITSSLPIDGIDFLLGNDLAGGKVVANSLVTDMPCNCQQLDPVPNLDPAGVVTRASKEQESITDTLVWESTIIVIIMLYCQTQVHRTYNKLYTKYIKNKIK